MNDDSTASIIKSDRIGRSHYSPAFKAEVLVAFDQSALSGQAFAEQCGIKYPTFASWLAKRRHANTAESCSSDSFILAEFAEVGSRAGLEVQLPGGAIARMNRPEQGPLLAALIKSLA